MQDNFSEWMKDITPQVRKAQHKKMKMKEATFRKIIIKSQKTKAKQILKAIRGKDKLPNKSNDLICIRLLNVNNENQI